MKTNKFQYSDLSSVAWVNSWWIGAVLVLLAALTIIPAISNSDGVSGPIIGIILVGILLFSYPYIHYRINGGEVQRIPPRYVKNKEFLSTNYL